MGFAAFRRTVAFVYIALSQVDSFCPIGGGTRRNFACRRLASSPSSNSNNSNRRQPVSAAGQERRDEEKRRQERKQDVVVGKTSALAGEKDYALDLTATQEEWMRQATEVEKAVFLQTELGMTNLKMLRLKEANEAFNNVFQLKPDAYLWQAGIARFYLDDLDGAADVFARCAGWFERKFGEPATEERIWRNACILKKFAGFSRKDRKAVEQSQAVDALVAQVPVTDDTPELWRSERRKVDKIASALFTSSVERDFSGTVLARAKLRSIGGAFDAQPMMDKKMWRISSWFYLGLHYDAMGDLEDSKKCMKMALRLSPNANSDDLIHTLPTLHMKCRDWFDDDDFEDDAPSPDPKPVAPKVVDDSVFQRRSLIPENADPLLIDSIQTSLAKMRYVDLQHALKARGIRAIGSKEELQDRLFDSLMIDTGLMP